ncbi:probable G-protein coupled receptor No18 [Culicoides brevitarsis]|uniref:probable G-protein coupled receptor No18 n=1 Tax=Culicoides brevitarsis TaxID=469753 RepID=UPI00307BAA58
MSMMGNDPMHWSEIVLIICFCLFIIITVIGNTLVILSVITTRRLRTVTNCFVMSLAVADWLVGLFVMPPAVLLYVTGTWGLGWILCDIWISLDVLLCTASILSLCAISIDRYLAVTQPLNYSRRRRSKRLALTMILVVWVLALAITCPPLIGWYEPGRRERDYECRYNENKGYVVFSAMGSFFIPMTVMIYVYIRISCVIARRHDQMAEIEVHKKSRVPENFAEQELGDSSENDHCPISPMHKKSHNDPTLPNLNNICDAIDLETNGKHQLQQQNRNGHYELMDMGSTPTSKRSSTLTYKISGSSENWPPMHQQQQQLQQPPPQSHHHRQQSVRSTDLTSKNIRVHQKSISTRITSMKRENKTTQTLSIVVGGFIACWLPFFIVYLVTPFIGHNQISENVKTCLTWLGWVNSAMNPFIYAFYSVDFRAAFWRLTLRKFFKNTRKPPYITNNMSIRR